MLEKSSEESSEKLMAIHESVDIELWIERFPIAMLREEAKGKSTVMPGGETITSPSSLAIVEQLRKEIVGCNAPPGAIPCDVFVFAVGEPFDRRITKVGGLPYRPASRIWPCDKSGQPLVFLAQFCFADSGDLIPYLPGEVLLIFGGPWDEPLHFEWTSLLETETLIEAEAIPGQDWTPRTCYGTLYRTWDCPDLEVSPRLYNHSNLINILEATKIGGVPIRIENAEIEGRFLAALGTISPPRDEPWPWVNQASPESKSYEDLKWGDLGSLFLFWDGKQVKPLIK